MARSTRGESAWTQTSAWFAPLVVVVVTVIAFLPTLRAGFVSWDDDKNFLANPHYRGLGLEQLGWMWSTFQLGHYVPLSWMSLGADYLVWGMDPAGYHATNLLLHAANSALVYFLARRVLLAARVGTESNSRDVVIASAISALAFSVHPLRVESVAWITERRDVLSLFFYLSSALLYLRSIEDNAHRDRWYWLSLAAFACALLSKATAVTLPAILVAFNCFPLRRLGGSEHGWLDHSARNVYRELFPFVLLSAATVTVTFVALQHLPQLDVMRKVAVSMYGIAFYTWKSVAPSKLAPLYAMPARVDPFAVRYVVSCIIVVTVSIAAWFVRRRWPMATLGWVTFLLGVFPMLGFVQNGPQLVADRYSYFAAPFLGLAVAAALLELNRRIGAAVPVAGGMIVGMFALLTWNQTAVWHDSMSLWTRVLQVEKDSPIALNNMGNLIFQQREYVDALRYYARAVALQPDYPEAHNNLGVALTKTRKYPEAIAEFQRAIASLPGYDEAHDNWGVALAAQGNAAEAIAQYQQAIVLNPENADAQVNWGNALLQLRNVNGAITQYQIGLRLRPDNADAYVDWGVALARQGKLAEAVAKFREAMVLRPGHPEAADYLRRSLAILAAQPVAQRP